MRIFRDLADAANVSDVAKEIGTHIIPSIPKSLTPKLPNLRNVISRHGASRNQKERLLDDIELPTLIDSHQSLALDADTSTSPSPVTPNISELSNLVGSPPGPRTVESRAELEADPLISQQSDDVPIEISMPNG